MAAPAGGPPPSIPTFTPSGVLPPYLGANPGMQQNGMSPYITSVDELVARFHTSPERRAILQGFLRFRQALRAAGLTGWHWLDGSFLEDIETLQARPPQDLDLVTFVVKRPTVQTQLQIQAFVQQHPNLFDRTQCKQTYHCDAFYIDLDTGAYNIVSQTRYWFGLFSHQRVTAIWKGMLEVELTANDVDGAARIAVGLP